MSKPHDMFIRYDIEPGYFIPRVARETVQPSLVEKKNTRFVQNFINVLILSCKGADNFSTSRNRGKVDFFSLPAAFFAFSSKFLFESFHRKKKNIVKDRVQDAHE